MLLHPASGVDQFRATPDAFKMTLDREVLVAILIQIDPSGQNAPITNQCEEDSMKADRT
jgi:hypothetical protein